jgi:hypothetical protein
MQESEYNDLTEVYLRSGKCDHKGREIGYVIGLNNNGAKFAAWVQNARRVEGDWKDFGVMQRSKTFASQEEATNWAYQTAHKRIAKL